MTKLRIRIINSGACSSQTLGWIYEYKGKLRYRIRPVEVIEVDLRKPEPYSAEFKRYVELSHDEENWRRLPRHWVAPGHYAFVHKKEWIKFDSQIPLAALELLNSTYRQYWIGFYGGGLTDKASAAAFQEPLNLNKVHNAISQTTDNEILSQSQLEDWALIDDSTAC